MSIIRVILTVPPVAALANSASAATVRPAGSADPQAHTTAGCKAQMPILDVEIVYTAGGKSLQGMAAAIADAAAAVFGTPVGATWVRLHDLPQEWYSENGGGPEPDVLPVFVRVLKTNMLQGAELLAEVSALTSAVARVCNRPLENVHIIYDPPAAGRTAFGGKLLKAGGTGEVCP